MRCGEGTWLMDRFDREQRPGDRVDGAEQASGVDWRLPFLAGLLLVAAVCLLLAGAVIAFERVHSDVVFPGVRVGDVSLGGMTREAALAALRPVYEEQSARPLLARAAGIEYRVTVAEIGASFDVAAAVDAAFSVGRTGSLMDRLSTQFAALTRGYTVESSGIRIDRPKMESFLARVAREVDRPVRDAELVVGDDFSVRVTTEVIGRKLDVSRASTAIEQAMVSGAASVELPVLETLPKVVATDLEEARDKLARIYSGPVVLKSEGRRWELSLKEIAGLVSVEHKVGVPAPTVTLGEQPLKKLIDQIAAEIDQPKIDGRYDWSNGNLKPLEAGQDGRKLNKDKALEMLRSAISGDQRVVALPVEVERAIGGSIGPSELGIKERIEFGQTVIAGVPEKVYNIKLAASRLNGQVVRPGETFSFNKALGPTTLSAGFKVGFGITINNGEMQTVPSVAGGICQVATTLLHAVFWAGYQIEERYPHMYWIASYGQPPRGMTGLDATVEAPLLDFKFTNNTENYLLIQAKTDNNLLVFELYGTKPGWKVEVEGPIISNPVKADPEIVRQEEPTWPEGRELWVERATDGFDVVIIRRVIQGDDVRTLNLKSRYQPARNVLMVGTKKPEPTPSAPSPTPSPAGSQPASPRATAVPSSGAPGTPAPKPQLGSGG